MGYATPDEYRAMFKAVRERVPNADKATFSAHCHNDLGLAVANSLAAIEGGVRQVECTVNGIGERAGNAALEEIVMALRVRGDAMPYDTGIDATQLMRISKAVSTACSFPVQYNKAIVGRNAFAHESGIHQDGMLKNNTTYEIMTPESVGVTKTSLVMGKHSGRAAFRSKLKEMGYELGDNQLEDAFTRDLGACRAAATPPTPGQVADMAASIVDAGRTQFDLSYLLTNLGPLALGPGVTGLWFTTVQTAGVEAVVVSAAGVAGGLQVTVAWPEPLLRPETGMAVADGLVSRLTELAASC